MSKRYAIVDGSTVVNVVMWDGDASKWQPPENMTANLLPDDSPVGPGYSFDGSKYEAPVIAVIGQSGTS